MPHNSSKKGIAALYEEHLSLGAVFVDGSVSAYEQEVPLESFETEENTAFLCDLSGVETLLFSGEASQAFASAAFSGKRLSVGECAFEAVLTGDGGVASIPLLARTGTDEYLMLDSSERADIVAAWLSFLASISQDGVAPYANMELTDAAGTHTVLALAGPAARAVVSDYLPATTVPRTGELVSCNLDGRIPSILMAVPLVGVDCFILFVAPRDARVLWRSLLSFSEVCPIGRTALRRASEHDASWMAHLGTTDALRLSAPTLRSAQLMRQENDFVGSRGIAAIKEGGLDR